jgi:hypothetical protein
MLYCDWQKQQNFSQVHCVSGLSHCEQRTVTVLGSPLSRKNRTTNTRIDAHGRQAASLEQLPGTRLGEPAIAANLRCCQLCRWGPDLSSEHSVLRFFRGSELQLRHKRRCASAFLSRRSSRELLVRSCSNCDPTVLPGFLTPRNTRATLFFLASMLRNPL